MLHSLTTKIYDDKLLIKQIIVLIIWYDYLFTPQWQSAGKYRQMGKNFKPSNSEKSEMNERYL